MNTPRIQLPARALSESSKPEWLCLPAPGARFRSTGLSGSTLNELTIAGPANDGTPSAKSVVLRKRGALRGIRLIRVIGGVAGGIMTKCGTMENSLKSA